MSDIPAMKPCPYGKHGAHCLSVITPGSDEGDVTLVCAMCGASRRFPANGSMLAGTPLDDWPANDVRMVAEISRGALHMPPTP